MAQFVLDEFVADVRDIAAGQDAANLLRTRFDQVFAAPDQVASACRALHGDVILFEDNTVSIWHTCFEPGISVPAHDHQLSAVIGVFQGRERNDFFEAAPDGGVQRSGQVELGAGDVLSIGPSAIHSVTCLSDVPCNGLHVYLGNLTKVERTLFNIDTGEALRFDDGNYQRLMAPDRFG